MHHGQSSEEAQKNKKDRKYEEFINFAEIGGICVIGLGGMDAPG